jgi:HAD superfamily hydrolase (TIGR01509 family)
MTNTAATTQHARRPNASLRAVLFDLSGTLLDEGYVHHGLAQLAAALHERWHIDPTTTRTGFMDAFRAVLQEYADETFSLMRDVICGAVERLIVNSGQFATRTELIDLEQLFWRAAIPTATSADGAIETLRRLRHAGIRTGIISYADIPVFEALLRQAGLTASTDVEVCSELARSCKPHPEIFHLALRTIGVEPSDAMFVGDDVDTDIVGANRIGMRTALLSGREFTVGDGSDGDPDRQPDHHVDSLLDVVDIVVGGHPSQPCP